MSLRASQMSPETLTRIVNDLNAAGFKDHISFAADEFYHSRIAAFWSASARARPHAIVAPKTTEDVVKIVKILVSHPEADWALRSGGHIAWGASNIEGGILVDFGVHMTQCWYNKETGLASVQPGGRWETVYEKIEPLGITVAGGRDGDVGVAGFLTGGGISWFIPRFGFGCDQIVNVEIVLADGSVVNANKDEHSDLWRALKGASAGNFGVVTRFDLATIPNEGLWGGMLISDTSKTAEHINAMHNYTNGLEANPNSSYIVLWNYEPTTFKDNIITSFAVNTKGIESPPELKELLDIPTIVRDMKHTNLKDHANSMIQPYGYHDLWYTLTVKNDTRIMQKAVDVHEATLAKVKALSKTGQFSSLCLFQGLPSFYSRLSDERGGNVMGLRQLLPPGSPNAISLLLSFNVREDEILDEVRKLTQEYVEEIKAYAKEVDGFIDWTYVNYADKSQNPLATLGSEALKIAQDARKKYDPNGVFQKRTPNGFKLSQV